MESYERYRSLVKEAWEQYRQGDTVKMAHSLEQSLQYTSYLRAETVCDWVSCFSKFSLETNVNLDIDFLSELSCWQNLMNKAINKDQLYSNFFHQVNQKKTVKKIKDIKVALILDEFSYDNFKYEFTPIIIEPNNWKEIFEKQKPDLFFCESAWSGIDSKRRHWKGQIYSSINFKRENRLALLDILEYCKKNNIPTIFWNKEDPTHYHDKVHNFIDTAKKFDYIFTTAKECVELYQKEHGCQNVYCLPFATQPKLFNPIEKYTRSSDVIFAGSWYANHKQRCLDMQIMFDAILNSEIKLQIYNRYFNDTDVNHCFPDKYLPFTKPDVPFNEIDKVYKSSIFGLNINTVQDSETMFARRVFELMSSNTLVISNYSKGLENLFGNGVIFLDKNPNFLQELTFEEIEEKREKILYNVLNNHTYRQSFQSILDQIAYPYIDDSPSLTVVCMIENENGIRMAETYYKKQILPNSKLLIVLSSKIPNIDIAPIYSQYTFNNTSIVSLDYLQKYSTDFSQCIETSHFALVDYKRDVSQYFLSKALLHNSYIEQEFISMIPGKKYQFSRQGVMIDVIAQKSKFKDAIMSYGQLVDADFYTIY
jgi:spore maturation protein CgeB